MDFVCPKCKRQLLAPDGKVKRCSMGHSFDRAKEGYFNLLLGASSGTHGDNADMVRARRDFLSLGYYYPMAKRVSELVLLNTKSGGGVLDFGLGEGYYTDIIESSLAERDGDSCVLGFDISKDAVKLAAKRNKRLNLAVASSYDIPIADSSVDTAVNIFSPLAISEVLRVLKPQGVFIMVYPDTDHLFGLKSAIYKAPYKNKPEDTHIEGFEILSGESLRYTVTLDSNAAIRSLFMMTPYAYRTGMEERERVLSLQTLTTEVQFCINVYKKL